MNLDRIDQEELKERIWDILRADDVFGMGESGRQFEALRSDPKLQKILTQLAAEDTFRRKFPEITPAWLREQEDYAIYCQDPGDAILEETQSPLIVAVYVFVSVRLYAEFAESDLPGDPDELEPLLQFAAQAGVPERYISDLSAEYEHVLHPDYGKEEGYDWD